MPTRWKTGPEPVGRAGTKRVRAVLTWPRTSTNGAPIGSTPIYATAFRTSAIRRVPPREPGELPAAAPGVTTRRSHVAPRVRASLPNFSTPITDFASPATFRLLRRDSRAASTHAVHHHADATHRLKSHPLVLRFSLRAMRSNRWRETNARKISGWIPFLRAVASRFSPRLS